MSRSRRRGTNPERSIEERRRNPRVELMSELYGCVVALDLPVLVRNASRGGFFVESACPFPVGSEHSFRFQTFGVRPTTVVAVCRHTQRLNRAGGEPRYAAGFEFVPQSSENLRRALAIIATATTAETAAAV